VIFMQTLTDGFTKPTPTAITFTGRCMTGGLHRRKGMSSSSRLHPSRLLATGLRVPPLPTTPIPRAGSGAEVKRPSRPIMRQWWARECMRVTRAPLSC